MKEPPSVRSKARSSFIQAGIIPSLPSNRQRFNEIRMISLLLAGLLLLTGCAQPAAQAGGGTIKAINHTKWAINHFSINGQSGIDIIGPFQGGGGGCCFSVPARWTPGMTVRVDWESGVAFARDIPEIPEPAYPNYKGQDNKVWTEEIAEYNQQKRVWYKKIKALKRQHSKTVPLPDYNGQDVCGITVHFFARRGKG